MERRLCTGFVVINVGLLDIGQYCEIQCLLRYCFNEMTICHYSITPLLGALFQIFKSDKFTLN